MKQLRVGWAEVEITPEPGVWLGGFWFREGPGVGAAAPLKAQATALDDGEVRLVILTADLVGFGGPFEQARNAVKDAAGVGPEAVLLAASHTHSGPLTQDFLGMGERSAEYERRLEAMLGEATRRAVADLAPAEARFGRADCSPAVCRRVLREGRLEFGVASVDHLDRSVTVLRFDRESGPVALFGYAMHPVVFPAAPRLASPDWVGPARDRLAELTGARVSFLQGACGEVNPPATGDPAMCEMLGREVGAAAAQAWEAAAPFSALPLAAAEIVVDLPTRGAGLSATGATPKPTTQGEELVWEAQQEYSRRAAEWEQAGFPPVSVRLKRFRLGEASVLAFGAEAFNAYQQEFGRGRTLVASCTDDLTGYLPTAADFLYGGYEVEGAALVYGHARLTADCEGLVRAAARSLGFEGSPAAYPPGVGGQAETG